MRKWIIMSALGVFAVYGYCIYQGIDMLLPLWISLAILGAIFYVADGMTIRRVNIRQAGYGAIAGAKEEHEYQSEQRKKVASDTSPISTIICSIGVALMLCLVHTYIFL